MAIVALSASPATLDSGSSDYVTVTNTGAVDVTVARGSQSFILRPNQSRTVYPEGSAVTATVASGTGQVTTLAQAAQVTQAQQVAANTAAIAGLPSTYVPRYPLTAAPSGGVTRRVAEVFGSPGSTTAFSGTNLLVRYPWTPPATTTRWRIRHRNYDYLLNAATAAGLDINGLYVGTPVVNSTGGLTGAFTATPTAYHGAYQLAPDGSEYVGPWITDPTLQFSRLQRVLLSFGVTSTSGGAVSMNGNAYGAYFNVGGAANAGVAAPTISGFSTSGWTGLEIEYETAQYGAVGLYVGDSITEAKSATSWARLHAAQVGAMPVVNAVGGATTSVFTTSSRPVWSRLNLTEVGVDYAVIFLGSNDANGSVSLATYQANMSTIITNIRTLTGKSNIPLFLATIPPRTFGATPEGLRTSYNTWLRGLPFGALQTFSFDKVLESKTDVTVLDAEYDSGDTIHPNTNGHTRMAGLLPSRVLGI
jgi:lysophospholipase L1-like esterase